MARRAATVIRQADLHARIPWPPWAGGSPVGSATWHDGCDRACPDQRRRVGQQCVRLARYHQYCGAYSRTCLAMAAIPTIVSSSRSRNASTAPANHSDWPGAAFEPHEHGSSTTFATGRRLCIRSTYGHDHKLMLPFLPPSSAQQAPGTAPLADTRSWTAE